MKPKRCLAVFRPFNLPSAFAPPINGAGFQGFGEPNYSVFKPSHRLDVQ